MKKYFISLIVFAIAITSFASETREYIAKPIVTDSGYEATSWSATGIWIDLKNPVCVITLEGNKDIQTRIDGKAIMGTRNVTVSAINAVPIYMAMHDAVVTAILADPQFAGGTLESVTVEALEN